MREPFRSEWLLALVLLLPLAGVAHAQSEPARPDATGESPSIRGRVVGEGGRPVAGAVVRAAVLRSSGGFSGELVANANRDGVFELRDVPPGFSRIYVIAPPLIVVDGIPDEGARPGDVLTIRMAKGAAITGRVVDENGAPLTGLRVTPELVRGESGVRTSGEYTAYSGGLVDDRGVYRIYELRAGTYVLSAGRTAETYERPVFLSDRVPTYYPSGSRSAASEISVRFGAEVANIDIVFRGDAGFRVGGKVVGAGTTAPGRTSVEIYRAREAESCRTALVTVAAGSVSFLLDAVEDGDYELMATAFGAGDGPVSSERVRVKVRGADVSGVTLTLMPMSQITGRVETASESKTDECAEATSGVAVRPIRLADVSIGFREVSPGERPRRTGLKSDGTFAATRLTGSKYRLWAEIADDELFVARMDTSTAAVAPSSGGSGGSTPKPLSAPATAASGTVASTAAPSGVARDGVNVVRGKSVDGLRFVVARGAARVRGRIAPAKEGESLPSRARVCLVPADPKQKDDVVHYYEVDVERDGAFEVRNVAPGEYFVVTRTFPGDDRPDVEISPAAWDVKERAALRAAGENLGIRLTLSPCQRLESAVVTLPAGP
ncbi:MAG: carboxypeptidase regulatory-like domain-containing protein [Blastocatellia bacterium]|nr:carboxypeptidase regulatory-like domain-containing protein [Blastocatellia bacterium]